MPSVGAIDEAFQSRVHLSLYYPHLSLNDTVEILASNLRRLPRVKQEGKNSSPNDNNNNNSNNGYIKVMDDEIITFIRSEYEDFSRAFQKRRGPWNGRQIRNAVQIAAGLALYDKEAAQEDDGLPAILTAGHFRSVAETMSEFEAYLRTARAGDDTWLAHQRQDRNDDFQNQHRQRQGGDADEEPFSDAGAGVGLGLGGSSRSPGFPPETRATPRGNAKSKAAIGATFLPGSAGSGSGSGSAAARRKGPPPSLAGGGGSGGRPAAAAARGLPAGRPARLPPAVQPRTTRMISHRGEFEYDEEDEFAERRHGYDDDFGGGEEEELGLEQELEGEEGEEGDWDGSPSHHHRQVAAAASPYGQRTSLVGRRTDRYLWSQDR
ncbi:hypothetical protein SLS62_001051 [Diatrype stigma]|uniref:AAA+ ATPase lid domain-containing protein n=1 Tax=Diatrype stigma TaxID=117547 RepID=A0AAN9UWY8_9PEZI